MVSIVSICQDAAAKKKNHHKCLKALMELEDLQDFFQVIFQYISLKKEVGNTDTFLKFLALFFTEYFASGMDRLTFDKGHVQFQNQLFDYLIEGLKAGDKLVRLRCCQLMTLLLNAVEAISDNHYEMIRKSLSERINDKDAAVRLHAVHGLCRFQDCGTDQENSMVLAQLVQLLKYDPRSDMRKSILENIVFSKDSISAILERARDADPGIRNINPGIRKMVYHKIKAEAVSYQNFTNAQISSLISFGCADRDESVKSSCLEMVYDTWLVDYEKLNQKSKTEAEGKWYSNADVDFNWDELTLSDLLAIEAYTQLIEILIPTLSFWVALIENTYGIHESIVTNDDCKGLLYMFKIAQNLDMCDETGRRAMTNLCKILLVDNYLLEENQKICVETMFSLIGDVSKFYATILGYVNSINLESGIDRSNGIRSLQLLAVSFESLGICYNSADLTGYFESTVVKSVDSKDQKEVFLGLKCLLLYSLQCPAFGKAHMDLFFEAIESTKKEVVLLVLMFFFDWILLHGFDFTPEQVKFALTLTPIMTKLLVSYLDYDYSKSVTVEGLCRCMLLKHITDENVFYKVLFALEMKSLEGVSISYASVISQLLEFTNPKLLLKPIEDRNLHLEIAIQGLELAANESPNFRKTVCNMLTKMDLPKGGSSELLEAASSFKQSCQSDLVCSRAMEKYLAVDFRFIQQQSE
ncbi:hypothetical protein HDV01_002770 [Terramyces sp. JEL0728]|nr:hypothetical protein HDV01_002770 [Terramyces sp. JEL0728]